MKKQNDNLMLLKNTKLPEKSCELLNSFFYSSIEGPKQNKLSSFGSSTTDTSTEKSVTKDQNFLAAKREIQHTTPLRRDEAPIPSKLQNRNNLAYPSESRAKFLENWYTPAIQLTGVAPLDVWGKNCVIINENMRLRELVRYRENCINDLKFELLQLKKMRKHIEKIETKNFGECNKATIHSKVESYDRSPQNETEEYKIKRKDITNLKEEAAVSSRSKALQNLENLRVKEFPAYPILHYHRGVNYADIDQQENVNAFATLKRQDPSSCPSTELPTGQQTQTSKIVQYSCQDDYEPKEDKGKPSLLIKEGSGQSFKVSSKVIKSPYIFRDTYEPLKEENKQVSNIQKSQELNYFRNPETPASSTHASPEIAHLTQVTMLPQNHFEKITSSEGLQTLNITDGEKGREREGSAVSCFPTHECVNFQSASARVDQGRVTDMWHISTNMCEPASTQPMGERSYNTDRLKGVHHMSTPNFVYSKGRQSQSHNKISTERNLGTNEQKRSAVILVRVSQGGSFNITSRKSSWDS